MSEPGLAWLSPLPPVRSGVSEYSADLLPVLAALRPLRLFAEAPSAGHIAGLTIEPPGAFDASPELLAVYHMGNNRHHRFVARRASVRPGLLVLHDLVLHHYWVEETLAHGLRDDYIAGMSAAYGEVGAGVARARADGVASQTEYFQFPLFEPLAAASLGVAVHNRRAADIVRRRVPDVPVAEIPMGIPAPEHDPLPDRALARQALGVAPEAFLVGTFGFLTPIKRPDVCLAAFAAFAREHPGARFVALGESSGAVDLVRTCARLGIEGSVLAPGYLPYAEVKRWIAAADVFLNLRYPTAGESSASLLRLLGWGKPVVVSDFAQFREIPEAAALRVSLGASEHAELVALLGALAERPERARALGAGAARFVAGEHSLERAAAAYVAFADELRARAGSGAPVASPARLPEPRRSSRTPRRPRVRIEVDGPAGPVLGGARLDLRARIINTGDTTLERWWTLDGGHAALAGQIYDADGRSLGEVGPIALPRDLAPGDAVELPCRFRLPAAGGKVVLLLDLLIHRWGWLRHRGGEVVLVPIDVRPAV